MTSSQIACVIPAIGIEDVLSILLVQTEHQVVSANQNLALLSFRYVLPTFWINNAVLGSGNLVTK